MERETILIKLANQTSDRVNIVTVRFISSALSFPISRLFAFLFASSVYIDFISISRSNRQSGLQATMKKGENIKCYSCFTLTTSHCGSQRRSERGEQKPKQHQFVATSDLSLDFENKSRKGREKSGDKKRESSPLLPSQSNFNLRILMLFLKYNFL